MRTVTGESVREARERAGLTQRQAGVLLRCTAGYLCDVEYGRRSISHARLERLAKFTGSEVGVEWVDCQNCNGGGRVGVPYLRPAGGIKL